ncbi:unnamed protein product [Pleuronectes platessa]|uniref:Uncharacterized protein n=1 Tax=Pleuronectes platessa TaxID=8262 RepID=A0A9N7ZB06_PLEPL|nr:unnamed protein product [Pleuronectes platessa]
MDKDESMTYLKLGARPKTGYSKIKQAKFMIPELDFHDFRGEKKQNMAQEELEAERRLWKQEKLKLQESLRAATQAVDEEKEESSKVRSELARLQQEHLQVTSSLRAALTSSQEELEAERSLWKQEKLEFGESLRAAIQAADEEEEESYKVRSALAQAVKAKEQSQSQWELEKSRLQEEHLQVTSNLTAALTSSQEELEAERSLWNQDKLEIGDSLRTATQAVDKMREERSQVRSALAGLQEEHLQVTSSLRAALTSSQEELEAERSLWNQDKLEFRESLRTATQAVDKIREERSKSDLHWPNFKKLTCR